MLTAVYKGIKKMDLETRDIPVISEDEILLQVKAATICGTDVKTFFKGHPLFNPPCVLGHEFSGIIDRVGRNINRFKQGERVVCTPYIECGSCNNCKDELGEICAYKSFVGGAFSEYIKIPTKIVEKGTFKLHKNISFEVATLIEPLACCINGIRKLKFEVKGKKILVIGGGPMGLLLSLTLKRLGCEPIISEISKERLGFAKKLEIKAVSPEKTNLIDFTTKYSDSRGMDAVIVALAIPQIVEEAFLYVKEGGVVEIFGGLPKDSVLKINPFLIHYKEIDLIGNFGFSSKHFKDAYEMISGSPELFEKFITQRYELKDIKKAFYDIYEKKGIKAVINF
ncbi:alcohol dehydrogenase catalytic domain-containing protein [bacterium]|nr:alcohol dehydrogenase catalytic domain-containing protein [bacterium]MBU4510548.1 alcohol dehydrogenase catalytic domain-containing protein [bacterium]